MTQKNSTLLEDLACLTNLSPLDTSQITVSMQILWLNQTYFSIVYMEVATDEIGSLHTLRLELLKPVFQPLHKCIVNEL